MAVYALRRLPGYGTHEYFFPAEPYVRFKDVEKFSRPHAPQRLQQWARQDGVTVFLPLHVASQYPHTLKIRVFDTQPQRPINLIPDP